MQLCRFMSKEELDRYLAWENLENHTDWKQEHNMTTSKGFCFFPVRETDTPEKLIHVLSGITTVQYVLEVEAPAGSMHRSYGIYRDIEKDDGWTIPVPTIEKTEYCTEKYSWFTMKMIRYARIEYHPHFPVTYLFHWNDGRTTEDTMPMHLNTEPHGEFSMWKAEFNFEAFKKYFMGGQ